MIVLPQIAALGYPNIDPEIFRIGWFALRWYSLAYIAGLLIGWWYLGRLARRRDAPFSRQHADDFFFWAAMGIIVGGRLGYVLFYKPLEYLSNPAAILRLWDGGMSFHGGLVGVILAVLLFCRKNRLDPFRFTDFLACVVPIGLFFGRLANFINNELWGKVSDLPWAMYSPTTGPFPRHPSQLYEAFLEGVLLFAVLNFAMYKTSAAKYPGMIGGMFFLIYGGSRYVVEFVREPDAHLGRFGGWITMGQILSLPMIAFGLYMIWRSYKVLAAKNS